MCGNRREQHRRELESESESFLNCETRVVIGMRAASEIELESELESMICCDTQYEYLSLYMGWQVQRHQQEWVTRYQ